MDMSFYPWFHNAIHRLLLQLTFQWNYWDAVRHFYAVRRAQSIWIMSPGLDAEYVFLLLVYYVFNMFLKTLALVFVFLIHLRFPKNLSFIQVIHKRYGNTVVKLVRKFEKSDFKHRKAALDLQFLKTCQEFKVPPKFL